MDNKDKGKTTMNIFRGLKDKLDFICQKKLFIELYCLAILSIAILAWTFNSLNGMICLLCISLFFLIFKNDFKLASVPILFFIFLINKEFELKQFPWTIVILGSIYGLMLIISLIRKGRPYRLGQFFILLFLVAITNLIPICWSAKIVGSNYVLYFLYFNWIGYLFFYMCFANFLEEKSLHFYAKVFRTISLLISYQCFYTTAIWMNAHKGSIIYDAWYTLGWGMCNEAGIMLLTFLPFVFIDLIKNKDKVFFLRIIGLLIICGGLFFTFSRGTYIFTALTFGLVFIYFLFKIKNKNHRLKFLLSTFIIILVFLIVFNNQIRGIINSVFYDKLNSSSRIQLYKDAYAIFTLNPRNFIFGSGIISEIDYTKRVIVYHSTFFETIVTSGLIGTIIFFIFFGWKYKAIIKNYKITEYGLILIGYLVVDLYGLIDNTYHMYYYMIYLVIIIAIMEKEKQLENKV